MNHLPRPSKPVVFIAVIFIALLSYSFLGDVLNLPVNKHNNFIADIIVKKDKAPVVVVKKRPPAIIQPKDSGKAVIPFRDYLTYDGIVSYEAEHKFAISKFITALKEVKSGKRKKVRIAYFGDSIIEGDLISEDLRRLLQDSFGGTGVGFVPVTSVVSGFRETVMHSYGGNWTDENFLTATKQPLFLSGHSFLCNGDATVQYGVTSIPHLQHFPQVYALYGKGNQPLQITVNNKALSLPTANVCSKALVARDCNLVRIKSVTGAPLYGFSFEDSSGVYIDNYAFRGISGIELDRMSKAFLQGIQQSHDYDLIIFQYGPNLLFKPKLDDFTWYETPMLSIIKKFKSAFTNASILVVSTADKAFRYNGEMETAIGVEPLLNSQNNFAAEGEVNLWNLYHAMGGRNSMLTWVDGDTALARKDYTHFNYKGAQRIATMLFTAMMKEYDLAP